MLTQGLNLLKNQKNNISEKKGLYSRNAIRSKAKALVLAPLIFRIFLFYIFMLTQVKQATHSHTANRHRRNYARLLEKRNILISPLKFAELHNGSLRMKYIQGLYFVGFESADKKTHAWGSSFTRAYRNFLRVFNEKYAV